jgi:hypothetical protein
VPFGEAEVDDVNAARIAAKHKIARLYISVDKAAFVDLPNRSQHLNQNVYRYLE